MVKPTPSPPPQALLLFGNQKGPRKGSRRYPRAGDERMKDDDIAVAPAGEERGSPTLRCRPPPGEQDLGRGEFLRLHQLGPSRATKLLGILAPAWMVGLAHSENLWPRFQDRSPPHTCRALRIAKVRGRCSYPLSPFAPS